MLNHVKQERIRSNSRCLRLVNRYRVRNLSCPALKYQRKLNFLCRDILSFLFSQVMLQFLLCTATFGSVGAVFDMKTESWLLKGILLACVVGVVNLVTRWEDVSSVGSV